MRILLVEDELDLGAAIQRVLKRENYIVDWVEDGDTAWGYIESGAVHYTLAILDWMVPGYSGVEICQKLRQTKNPLPILILTAKDQIKDRVQGLDAGADDYLVKPFSMAELLARIRALQRRSPHIQTHPLQIGDLTLDYGNHRVCYQQKFIELTTKEFQILEYLMRHSTQIITSEQLLNQLWEVGAEP
ncbi:two-component sensor histidine kinase, partial [Gloeomargarita lithophora Alchichica-D10]